MVFHSVKQLTTAGITDVLIVTNPQYVGDFVKALGSGKDFGCEFTYRVQEEARGIAHALALAEGFARDGRIVVLLGTTSLKPQFSKSSTTSTHNSKGRAYCSNRCRDPERYGVATLKGKHIVAIEEKPKHPKSDYAVVGAYFYDASVFDIIRTIEPSARGEYEITTVNNAYIQRGELEYSLLRGKWTDAGTFDSLNRSTSDLAEFLDLAVRMVISFNHQFEETLSSHWILAFAKTLRYKC